MKVRKSTSTYYVLCLVALVFKTWWLSLFNKLCYDYYIDAKKKYFHVHIIIVVFTYMTEKEIVQADFTRSADVKSNRVSNLIRF